MVSSLGSRDIKAFHFKGWRLIPSPPLPRLVPTRPGSVFAMQYNMLVQESHPLFEGEERGEQKVSSKVTR